MVPKLKTRIADLERLVCSRQEALQHAIERALPQETSDLELLLSACGADSVGSPLTEQEIKARQTHEESLKRECRKAGIPFPIQFDHACYVDSTLSNVLANGELDLHLAMSGLAAEVEGRPLSADESAALLALTTEHQRLQDLANGKSRRG